MGELSRPVLGIVLTLASIGLAGAAALGYLPHVAAVVALPIALIAALLALVFVTSAFVRLSIQTRLHRLATLAGSQNPDDIREGEELFRSLEAQATAPDIEGVPELVDAARRPGALRGSCARLLSRLAYSKAVDDALATNLGTWPEADLVALMEFYKKEPGRAREVGRELLVRASRETRLALLDPLMDAAPPVPDRPWLELFSPYREELNTVFGRVASFRRPKFQAYLPEHQVR